VHLTARLLAPSSRRNEYFRNFTYCGLSADFPPLRAPREPRETV